MRSKGSVRVDLNGRWGHDLSSELTVTESEGPVERFEQVLGDWLLVKVECWKNFLHLVIRDGE